MAKCFAPNYIPSCSVAIFCKLYGGSVSRARLKRVLVHGAITRVAFWVELEGPHTSTEFSEIGITYSKKLITQYYESLPEI